MNKLYTKRIVAAIMMVVILINGGSHLSDFSWPRGARTRATFITVVNVRKLTSYKLSDMIKTKDDGLYEK